MVELIPFYVESWRKKTEWIFYKIVFYSKTEIKRVSFGYCYVAHGKEENSRFPFEIKASQLIFIRV